MERCYSSAHDRSFLNNIVTSTLVFGSGGKVREFVGGYDDWLRQSGGMLADGNPGRLTGSATEKYCIKDGGQAAPGEKAELHGKEGTR